VPPRVVGSAPLLGTDFLYPQVSTAEVSDAASYMCVAENQAGSAEKLFTLRVQGELTEQIASVNSLSFLRRPGPTLKV
jgi:hypothetical protein